MSSIFCLYDRSKLGDIERAFLSGKQAPKGSKWGWGKFGDNFPRFWESKSLIAITFVPNAEVKYSGLRWSEPPPMTIRRSFSPHTAQLVDSDDKQPPNLFFFDRIHLARDRILNTIWPLLAKRHLYKRHSTLIRQSLQPKPAMDRDPEHIHGPGRPLSKNFNPK